MNVPLKKRHNYGKINGSVSSVNGPEAKPSDDSDQLSCIEVDSSSNEDLQANMRTLSNTLLLKAKDDRSSRIQRRYSTKQQKSVGTGVEDSEDLSSSSVMMSSSASDHDPASEHNDELETSSETNSDESGSSRSTKPESDSSEAQYYRALLTEDSVKTHEFYFPPMSTYDRISYWKLADECSEIEDDFDDATYSSKPIRSERLQKRMYKKPPPSCISTTSRKTKKNERKTDEPSPAKKPKIDEKSTAKTVEAEKPKPKRNIWKNLQPSTRTTATKAKPTATTNQVHQQKTLVQRIVIEQRTPEQTAPDEIPSAIKFRISYNKTPSPSNPKTFNGSRTSMLDTSLNRSGCRNCSTTKLNGSLTSAMSKNQREEFYKYLGIDTNPPQEKLSPEPSTSDQTQQQHRRSLRVFIQQKQMESITKSNEDLKIPDYCGLNKRSPQSMLRQHSADALNVISSSHIQQRRSYEPANTSPETRYNGRISNILAKSMTGLNETERKCDEQACSKSMINGPITKRRIRRRRNSLLPSPMMLDEIFKRYKKCIQQGYVLRNQLQNQQFVKKARRQTTTAADDKVETEIQTENDCDVNMKLNATIPNGNVEPIVNQMDHTFSSIATSTDGPIQTNGIEHHPEPIITIDAAKSLEWHKEKANDIDKCHFRNPLNPKNGAVHAILTHSKSANKDDIVVVVQDKMISFWQATSRVLCMFGLARSWMLVGEIERVSHGDLEISSLYQHRLVDFGCDFPAYVELRIRESPGDHFRNCCLSFSYLNVYFMKSNDKGQPIIARETINLDTVKGFASSINYIALKNSPSILMTWTERNVNNQTRCGIVKYTMRTPTFDKIVDIFDYSYLQHDINTLYELNDFHIVGCGDRTISMWDHQSGTLLIDFEIDLPTIGRNIGCFTIGVNRPEYMLLIQLTSNDDHPGKENLLKVMAVQTVDPYNWRTLQTHDIPSSFGSIQSIYDNDNMLIIAFTSGTFLLLNILSPHTIYVRNVNWDDSPQPLLRNALNGVSASGSKKDLNEIKNSIRLYPQPNGQIIELRDNNVMTKSIWEYFVNNNNK